MKRNQSITTAVVSILRAAVLLALWPGTVEAAGTPPSLNIRLAGSNAEVIWDDNANGYVLQSSPLVGPGAHWLGVSGAPNPILGLGSQTVSIAKDSASFYRTLFLDVAAPRSVNVPELEFGNRSVRTNLTVLLLPESQLIELGATATFVVIVDGYTNSASELTYRWELNKFPYTAEDGSTNLTWRDLHIETNTNFVTIPGSPTNSNFFTIPAVSSNDVAYYRVTVTAPGPLAAISAAVPLWAWQQTNSIIVYGTPVAQNGTGICIGSYNSRVEFGGFWPVPPGPYSATSLSGSSDAIAWHDYYNTTYGCQTGSASISVRITVPYYFSVYSTSSAPPNPYLLYLGGFR